MIDAQSVQAVTHAAGGRTLLFCWDNQQVDNSHMLGHMLNDSGVIRAIATNDSTLPNEIRHYLLSSQQNNCQVKYLGGIIPCVVSKQEIAQDEELSMSYGPRHWLTRRGLCAVEIEARLRCAIEQLTEPQLRHLGISRDEVRTPLI